MATATQRKTGINIIVVGDSISGKTSIVQQYVYQRFSDQYGPTVGAEFATKEILIDNRIVTIEIWGTGGEGRFQGRLQLALDRDVDCCVIVFDVTSSRSFNNLDSWRDQFLAVANPPDPNTFPFVVLGNKMDLENREVSMDDARKWCESRNILYFETSAKEAVNLDGAFRAIADMFVPPEIDDEIDELLDEALEDAEKGVEPKSPFTPLPPSPNKGSKVQYDTPPIVKMEPLAGPAVVPVAGKAAAPAVVPVTGKADEATPSTSTGRKRQYIYVLTEEQRQKMDEVFSKLRSNEVSDKMKKLKLT